MTENFREEKGHCVHREKKYRMLGEDIGILVDWEQIVNREVEVEWGGRKKSNYIQGSKESTKFRAYLQNKKTVCHGKKRKDP